MFYTVLGYGIQDDILYNKFQATLALVVGSQCIHLGQSFSTKALWTFGVGFTVRGGHVHCRMFVSMPGLYLLHASSILPINCDNQKYLDIVRCPWVG